MRRRYFATFRLGDPQGNGHRLEDVFDCCRQWIFDPSHRLGEPDEFGYEPEASHDWELGHGHRVLVRSYQEGDMSAFGVSYQHPDREEDGLAWRTDICAGRELEDSSPIYVAVTLYAGYTEPRMAPGGLPVSRPRIVRDLVSRFPAHAGRLLQREPRVVEVRDVPPFVEFLSDDGRQLPVLFCSALNQTDKPLVQVERLADQLVGLAHVYVGANRFTSFRLEEEVGRALNTFNGSVRIYWPEFTKSDRPFAHKLWIARNLVDRETAFHDEVLRTLARVSTGRMAPPPIRWEEFERRRSARRIRELQEEGTDEELIEAYEEILADQDAELEALRQQVSELRRRLKSRGAVKRAGGWRGKRASRQRTKSSQLPSIRPLLGRSTRQWLEWKMSSATGSLSP